MAELAGSGVGVATLRRLFGGSVGEIGDALTRFTGSRLRNVGRVVENADRKSGPEAGAVPERVALAVLNEGSYSDDPWVVDYLGGVLASSRSGRSRDDRGVYWTQLISRLSAYDLRCHYIWYNTVQKLCRQQPPVADVNPHDANELAMLPVIMPTRVWEVAMDFTSDELSSVGDILTHCLHTLGTENLVIWTAAAGAPVLREHGYLGAPEAAVIYTPTLRGIQLSLWGAGLGHQPATSFLGDHALFPEDALDVPAGSFFDTPDNPWRTEPSIADSSPAT